MQRFRRFIPLVVMLLYALSSERANAQTTGTIEGEVTDQSGAPLPGVTMELTGIHLQGAKTAVTAADGRYRFLNLVPGDYTVLASLTGFGKTQKKATVSLDATAQVNLQLSLSTSAEVVVTGDAPLIDSTSTTAGSNFAGKVIDKLPLSSRNYADIVFTQPGVQADDGETQGRSLALSIYGSTSAENSFLIDGVNTTNVIKGIQGKDINNEFIQEVEVKTSGYQAEYGRNTGGVINVITKSGGNEFHGGVFGYYNNLSMAADQVNLQTADFSRQGDTQSTTTTVKNTRSEGGLDLGGFMVKDRVWFFAAYDRVITGNSVVPTTGNVEGEVFPATLTENKYSLKLTLNLAQSTTLQGVYFSDRESQTGRINPNPQSVNPLSYNGRIDIGGPDYGARLNQLFGSSGIATISYGQHSDRYETKPNGLDTPQTIDLTTAVTNPGVFNYTGGYGNIAGYAQNNHSKRQTIAGTYTGYVGNHEFKAGGDYEKLVTTGSNYWTGGNRLEIIPCLQSGTRICDLNQAPFYTNPYGDTYQVFYQHRYYTTDADPTNYTQALFIQPTTKRYSGFVQDQWRITPALTVNVGVRYDSENLAGTPSFLFPDGGGFSLKNEWAPRVGVTWDFAGDGTSKLYASAGRFYYALPTDITFRSFSPSTTQIQYNYNDSTTNPADFVGGTTVCTGTSNTGTGCVPRLNFTQVGGTGEPTDPDIKASYQDEFTIGVEKAIDPTLSVGLKGTYRSLGRAIEDRCDLNSAVTGISCAIMNPGATGPGNGGAEGIYGSCDTWANPTDPNSGTCTGPGDGTPTKAAKRIFKGIELVVRKQFTNEIWAQLSYLGSTLTGTYSGAVRQSDGQTDPGINSDYDYYLFMNNFSGRLELDRTNQGRLDAVYNAPWGLSAGLQFYVRTGVPTSELGFYNSGYGSTLYNTQRGYAGRLPTDYEMNASIGYNFVAGPVTVTPIFYAFQLLNNQTITAIDQRYNPNQSFVTDPASPFYGQAGVEPGTYGPSGELCPANAPRPCTDNPDYRKATSRTSPRQFRVALKVTF
ncbi:MAG TPA: TonB-dependent receptor [Thermoanaerobaculia bacterium]|nr:TonB-dependent receptor [Thermoanaerobaculia bacterium]